MGSDSPYSETVALKDSLSTMMHLVPARRLRMIPNFLIMDQNKKKRALDILVDRESLREAGNSFQNFPSSSTLTDEYYLCLSSDITILVSRKCLAIGETNLYGIIEYHGIGSL